MKLSERTLFQKTPLSKPEALNVPHLEKVLHANPYICSTQVGPKVANDVTLAIRMFHWAFMGRPQSADNKSLFEQETLKIGTQKCSTKRGVREPEPKIIPVLH